MNPFVTWWMAAVLVFGVGSGQSVEGQNGFLDEVIYSLPAKYFADIPLEERAAMMTILSRSGGDERVDFDLGWMHWFSDNSHRAPTATSMLLVKVLPRTDKPPLVLVHMPKPFANGLKPEPNQTFVLDRENGSWNDVTDAILPKEVGRDLHFRPQKRGNTIEVAEYARFERQDGRGTAYRFGTRKMDLFWNGTAFEVRKPASPELTRGQ
jgi:hypothetical protein